MLSLALATSALIAALNPCTMGVFTMSISSLIGSGKHHRHTGIHSLFFALGVGVTTLGIGSFFFAILQILPLGVMAYVGLLAAFWLVFAGLVEIKDYFWYGRGLTFKLGKRSEAHIHAWTKKHHSHYRGFLLGIYSSLLSAHYTSPLILALMVLVRVTGEGSFVYPALWAGVYMLPLLSFSQMVLYGVSAYSFTAWREQTKASMRLGVGLLFVLIAWVVMLSVLGGVNFL